MSRQPWKAYFLVVLLAAVAAGAHTAVTKVGKLSIGGCNASLYSDDLFIGVCHKDSYGDYEHGALFYGFEREAVARLKAAQVLFTGSSTAQHAFSTQALRDHFARTGIPYYIAAMSYGERDGFFVSLVQRHRLSPKVVVVNADPYFTDSMSRPAQEVVSRNTDVWMRYLVKQGLQVWQRSRCAGKEARAEDPVCGTLPTVYRSRADGHWVWEDVLVTPKTIPVELRQGDKPFDLETTERAARKFLRGTGMEPSCVVLVASPWQVVWTGAPPEAELARRLGMTFIDVQVSPVATIDGNHLTRESAERWSARLMDHLQPVLERCGARPPG